MKGKHERDPYTPRNLKVNRRYIFFSRCRRKNKYTRADGYITLLSSLDYAFNYTIASTRSCTANFHGGFTPAAIRLLFPHYVCALLRSCVYVCVCVCVCTTIIAQIANLQSIKSGLPMRGCLCVYMCVCVPGVYIHPHQSLSQRYDESRVCVCLYVCDFCGTEICWTADYTWSGYLIYTRLISRDISALKSDIMRMVAVILTSFRVT